MSKFSLCSDGANWFKQKGQWQGKTYIPVAGDIIFFDRDKNRTTNHVGIVVDVADGKVNTIEGNSGDVCKRRSYSLDDETIYGYGILEY